MTLITIIMNNDKLCCNSYFLYTNARSILNKLPELNSLISLYSPLFVSLTETWLSNSFDSSELSINNYIIHRNDRLTKGGGVLLAHKQNVLFKTVSHTFETEIVAVDLCVTPSSPFRLITAYKYNPNTHN